MIGDILQPTHLLFILLIALLVLGPKRLPEVGRTLGRGLRDFRNALSGDDSHEDEVMHPAPPTVEAGPEPTVEQGPEPIVEPGPEPTAKPESQPVEEPVQPVG